MPARTRGQKPKESPAATSTSTSTSTMASNVTSVSPSTKAANEAAGTVVFFHPDLGIGGAERLVVDAAVGLKERGHRVVIFTNHCDPGHCFEECRDGTLDVRVRGTGIVPPTIFSRFAILCAILRHVCLLFQIAFFTGELRRLEPAVFHVDQLSACLPLLRWLVPNVPIVFYCHFPDLLLARGRDSFIKRIYRLPFDWVEEWSMGFAHAVAVNSEFTRGVVDTTWPGLKNKVKTKVVYPCVDTEAPEPDVEPALEGEKVILSINRFEKKKDVALAIRAYGALSAADREGTRLVIAGGYDLRVSENYNTHKELEALADSLGLPHATMKPSTEPGFYTRTYATSLDQVPSAADAPVLFCLSIPDSLKASFLKSARLLTYTPSNEHFGIVPLEAMLARVPVLAANSGGPVETVVDGRTGWLRDPEDVRAWTGVMRRALGLSASEVEAMGAAGEKRVREEFGRDRMAARLDLIIEEVERLKVGRTIATTLVSVSLVVSFIVGGLASAKTYEWLQGKETWRRVSTPVTNWLMAR